MIIIKKIFIIIVFILMPPHHNASCVVIINNHIYHVKSIKPRLSEEVLFEGPDHILIKTNLIRAHIHKTGL